MQSQIRHIEKDEIRARAKEENKQKKAEQAPSTARSGRKKNKKNVSQLIEAFEPLMSPPRRGRGRPRKQ